MRNLSVGILLGVLLAHGASLVAYQAGRIRLPPGFHIDVYADNVPNARSMVLGEAGTLFVGTRTAGRVYALRDENHDGVAGRRYILAEGLDMPNGVAFRNKALYVAESGAVLRFDDIEAHLDDPPKPVVVRPLPAYRHHGWRYIAFSPGDRLYVSLGAPCNVCDRPGFGRILRMKPDGTDLETVALGVRNSVGFDWCPETGRLWFTDNGRDWLGDDLPPDELNRVGRQGAHFGFPFCHGGAVQDPIFRDRTCRDFTPPALKLPAHVAPLGIRFYTGQQFPERYLGQAFVAEHGSWNRSAPVGYQVVAVHIEDGRVTGVEPFATGWLRDDGEVIGRPVDLLVMPDGALLVSDDRAGVICRITYRRARNGGS